MKTRTYIRCSTTDDSLSVHSYLSLIDHEPLKKQF